MEKIWLKNYPDDVPAEINPDQYDSLVSIFEESIKQYRNLPAYFNIDTSLTYDDVDRLSRQVAAYFQSTLSLKKGDRVAIMLPNLLQYPVVLFGALRAGLTVVNINPLYTSDELTHQLNDCGATTIIVLENFAFTVQQSLPNLKTLKNIIVTRVGDLISFFKGFLIHLVLKYVQKKIPDWHIPSVIRFKDILSIGSKAPFNPVPLKGDDIAFLQYTGGTTGVSKGAILTHRNMLANLLQAEAWFGETHLRHGKEIMITALPLYHIFSLTANCFFLFKIGGFNVLITNPRDVKRMIGMMSKFKFNAITGVNTLFSAMLKTPEFKKLDFSGLRLTLGGGMATQAVIAEEWKKVTGCMIVEAYGLTETSPCVTINPHYVTEFTGSIGLPVSSTLVAILNENGEEVPYGEPGELAVKGPQVMKGYWNQPEETRKVFTKDGWLLTGDMARMDENGYVKLLERKKDMVLVSGFNVYPNEVEDVIAKCPGVKEVAVIGIPDEVSGEVPKAFIVKEDPALTANDVITYTRKHLTGYKIPRSVEFIDELPKTNVGKILRRALKSPSKVAAE